MDRRVLKVKYRQKDKLLYVKYEQDQGDYVDTFTLESYDSPRQQLLDALQAFGAHVADILEFPEDYAEDITVLGITWTWANMIRGCVITARKELEGSNAPLVLNTPNFTEEPYTLKDDEGLSLLTEGQINSLDRLESEIFTYIDGQRAQGDLFQDVEEDSWEFDFPERAAQ